MMANQLRPRTRSQSSGLLPPVGGRRRGGRAGSSSATGSACKKAATGVACKKGTGAEAPGGSSVEEGVAPSGSASGGVKAGRSGEGTGAADGSVPAGGVAAGSSRLPVGGSGTGPSAGALPTAASTAESRPARAIYTSTSSRTCRASSATSATLPGSSGLPAPPLEAGGSSGPDPQWTQKGPSPGVSPPHFAQILTGDTSDSTPAWPAIVKCPSPDYPIPPAPLSTEARPASRGGGVGRRRSGAMQAGPFEVGCYTFVTRRRRAAFPSR